MLLVYESETGYHEFGKRTPAPGLNAELMAEADDYRAPAYWHLPPGKQWQEHTWRIPDACFIGKWGWTFQIKVEPSARDVWVKEVQAIKLAPSNQYAR